MPGIPARVAPWRRRRAWHRWIAHPRPRACHRAFTAVAGPRAAGDDTGFDEFVKPLLVQPARTRGEPDALNAARAQGFGIALHPRGGSAGDALRLPISANEPNP